VKRARDYRPKAVRGLKHAAKRALAVLLVANFLGYATVGPNGMLRLNGYHSQKNERARELTRLGAERAKLLHHIDLLDPNSADPDLVEELLRAELGLVRPDEVIILVP
jgi:cell division protein FtsB